MALSYTHAKRKLLELIPRSKLGRFTSYLLAVDALLFAVYRITRAVSADAAAKSSLPGWINFLTFWVIVFGTWLAFRWLRDKMLWRLRNRLIVTYVFIGLIPVEIGRAHV